MAELAVRSFSLEPFDYAEVRSLMEGLGLAEPVAVTLVRRGYRTVASARAFLDAAEDHDPFLFNSMVEICDRLHVAITTGRQITVHGDYDVDGVCSTAILVRTIRALGGNCDWLIPARLEDGYGLTTASVERLAQRGTALLLTADCGIGSVAEVDAALDAGIEVIVTDHHQPGEELPGCPILHPSVSEYPFTELCATAVAFKLAVALRGERGRRARAGPGGARDDRRPRPAARREQGPGAPGARGRPPCAAPGPARAARLRVDRPRAARRGRLRLPARAADQRRRAPLSR